MSLLAANYIRMKVSDLTTPQAGRSVMLDHWWLVTDDDEVLFYKHITSPQCNTNRSIVERLGTKEIKTTPRYIPIAYLPHNCQDYV
jgi:hypothetical protein